jgi:hypothetical protein
MAESDINLPYSSNIQTYLALELVNESAEAQIDREGGEAAVRRAWWPCDWDDGTRLPFSLEASPTAGR